jgi:hypothetical protein
MRCGSSSTLTRYVALDTKFVEATRQEYVLFLRPANGKIAFIRIAGDLAQGQAQCDPIAVANTPANSSKRLIKPRCNQAASGLSREIEQCSVTNAPCITLSPIHLS